MWPTTSPALGGRAVLVGVVGRDAAGDCLKRVLATLPGIECAHIDTDERPTICKTRFIAANQQVVRTDDESLMPLSAVEHDKLLTSIRACIGRVGAIVLSDYGKGVLTRAMVAEIIRGGACDERAGVRRSQVLGLLPLSGRHLHHAPI